MKHLGDITKISGYDAPAVSVVIGGSPCQDVSVAGKRAGFDGKRSVLFLDQIRVIGEMREEDERNGRTGVDVRPRFMVWENVPGTFSSRKGEDFRVVLEETARVKDPDAVIPRPAGGKWRNAGVILGDGWSIAWRVYDAQFWGVTYIDGVTGDVLEKGTPQRRRRITLIADFGGHTAPEILFERGGLPGDPETVGKTREGTAGDAENGVGTAVDGVKCLTPWDTQNRRVFSPDGCMSTYQAREHSGQNSVAVCLNDQGGSVMGVSENVAGTLRAEEHGHQPAVCIQRNMVDRDVNCNGKGWRDDDVSYTLNTIDRPAVYAIDNHPQDSRVTVREDGKVQTLSERCGTGGNNVPMCIGTDNPEIAGTLDASYYEGTGARNGNERTVVAHTLTASGNDPHREDAATYPIQNNTVRRLTPLECERLQGYPDGWTDIGEWMDSKGKKHISSDSARYKALGNSIALPPWRYVLGKLIRYCEEKTMASLFDGIGGFPLIWGELGGETLWASEIEEFPIAVTRRRFGAV